MTSRISKLVLAAALAASFPVLAAAHDHDGDCDHDRDRDDRPVVVTEPVYAPPPAAAYPAPPAYGDGWREDGWREGAWRDDGWRDDGWRNGGWRGGGWRDGWRARALSAIHADLAALDAQRAEFYEHNGWRPGLVRRYDRWYFARRAELERRELELERVAWR